MTQADSAAALGKSLDAPEQIDYRICHVCRVGSYDTVVVAHIEQGSGPGVVIPECPGCQRITGHDPLFSG